MLFLYAEGAAEATKSDNPVLPVANEVFWAAICFAALFFLVRFVFLPPVTRVMDERSSKIKGDLEAAEKAKYDTSNLSSNLDEQLVDVRTEAAAIVDQARTEAAAERLRIVSKAEREVAAMKEVAQGEMDRERAEALGSLKPTVANLSIAAATKVLGRRVDAQTAKPLVNQFFSEQN